MFYYISYDILISIKVLIPYTFPFPAPKSHQGEVAHQGTIPGVLDGH